MGKTLSMIKKFIPRAIKAAIKKEIRSWDKGIGESLNNQFDCMAGQQSPDVSQKFPEPFHLHHNPDSLRYFNLFPQARELFLKFMSDKTGNNIGDFSRFYAFILHLSRVNELKISGDFAELGVYRGNSAAILAYYADQMGRHVYLFDTFSGFDSRDLTGVDETHSPAFGDTDTASVKRFVGHDDICHYCVGLFPESIPDNMGNRKFSFVSIDCDLHKPMKAGLEFFYPKMSPGGYLFLHDYSSGFWPGCKKAVDDFCAIHKISPVLLPDKSGTVIISIPL